MASSGDGISTYNWWILIALCVAMQMSSFIAGIIPLSFTLSGTSLRVITAVGAGLLVGTALVVIIPEGVHAIYSSQQLQEGGVGLSAAGVSSASSPSVSPHSHHEHGPSSTAHRMIGIMLVLGFVFMFIVDQVGGAHAKRQSAGDAAETGGGGGTAARRRSIGLTATLGLIVHAAADGVALGAAAATAQMSVEMIVFLAIMLHKAPAAFGLVTFLIHEGLEKSKIRRHLLIFTLAAPVLAIFTFIILLIHTDKQLLSEMNATGMAMLFSAGTFLYVATVHVLPEITSHDSGDPSHEHTLTKTEIISIILGALAPVVISIEHHH